MIALGTVLLAKGQSPILEPNFEGFSRPPEGNPAE